MPTLPALFLMRDGTAPLPVDTPSYTFTLTWTGSTVKGEGTVRVPNAGPTPLTEASFLLHGNDDASPTTSVHDVRSVGRTVKVDADVRELLVHVEPPVPPGGTLELGFTWSVQLTRQPDGIDDVLTQGMMQLNGHGNGDYGLQARGEGVTVVAGGFPMLRPRVGGVNAPRMVRPEAPIGDQSWNVPARWDVTVVPPTGVKVVTNLADEVGPTGQVHARGEGPWDFVFVGYDDPVTFTRDVDGVMVRSWARRGDEATGRVVLDEACRSLRFLQRYGPYPYRELDIAEAALSGGAGGVEFGGLALVASFLYPPPGAPGAGLLASLGPGTDLGEMRSFVVAHEVAHQWSPGFMGADAWASPIIDEPLAQYLAWRVLAGGVSSAEADGLFERQVTLGYAGMRMMGGEDGVAARETTAFPDALTYGGLVYGKAPHLYRTLHRQLGPEKLDAALRTAIAARPWTVVDAAGWLALLESSGATGAVAESKRWWYGETGDADLGLDPEGHTAMKMVLGPQAELLEGLLEGLGSDPAQLFQQLQSMSPELFQPPK